MDSFRTFWDAPNDTPNLGCDQASVRDSQSMQVYAGAHATRDE